ncbi:MAG TPA: Do family serine endopeptidase [Blastocatellia bacterium]|nr:Do family serine endopeptidase [Blastocatellia bacterium]
MGVNLNIVKRARIGVGALIFALAIAIGLGFEIGRPAFAQQSQAQLPSPADLSRTFINVAKQVKPAVVNIDVVERSKGATMRLPEGFPQIPGFPDGQPRRQRGTGSGVVISSDGYILTNNHVAGDAEQIKVKLTDGREFKAKRIGADPETDLAVIKIETQGLPFARLGNSDSLEQGEWVIALGSPFGLEQTMTAGIVSATGRDLPGAGQFTHFIQTDASINPGNSGGPLINMQGEVVGINTLIFSQTGTSAGIGFAIPSNLATKIYAQLIKSGKVTRGYLGVMLRPLTPAIAKAVGYEGTDGAQVQDVTKTDSPAARAGLRSGDVIVEFEGKKVKNPAQLTELVADTPVGKPSQLKYVRDGRTETTTVSLGERPASNETREEKGEEDENGGALGLSTQSVTPEMAREMKLKITSGVVVRDVQGDSPAAEAGLQRGDVIHRINRMPITNRQDYLRAIQSLRGEKEIAVQFERGGQLQFITISLD